MPTQEQEEGAQGEEEEVTDFSLEELLYSSSSYNAIVKPVALTMILTALCVVYINTEETIREGEQALSSAYEVFDNSGADQSTAETLGLSLVNALIIVAVIGAMTFVIVALYKYRCLKCLIGYMIFSSALLLGFLGGVMWDVAIQKYNLSVDQFTFYFVLYNFGIVGTFSIFWQYGGVPSYITQGYLIATSVILAWQLSHFDAWTSWTLLVMLALYDLCAVLTPCGPLKALVNLMSQDDAPPMPGLLYEAELPSEARRPGRRRSTMRASTSNNSTPPPAEPPETVEQPSASSTDAPVATDSSEAPECDTSEQSIEVTTSGEVSSPQEAEEQSPPPSGRIPLAIARLYRLELVEPVEPAVTRRNSFTPLLNENGEAVNPDEATDQTQSQRQYSVEQLKSIVEANFPRNGGRIDRIRNSNGDIRYQAKDRHGEIKRVLFVNDEGKVFEERQREGDDEDDDGRGSNNIKLGLGDFIFYSVLVSKAVQYSFTTFAACMLVILAGLGGTLVLLAVYRHALPALPISIFLGVVFYLLTRLLMEPYIEQVLRIPFYV